MDAARGRATEELGVNALLDNERARARIALIWKMRAVGEHQSTARFAAYAKRMRELGVPPHFQDEAFAASEQELRHREVCVEMAQRLRYGEITFETQDFTPIGPHGPANLLADMVAFGCLVETLNVAQLSTFLRDITEPEIRQATRKLLADEVGHSRLGWAYLAWAHGQGEGRLLAPHLPYMLWEAVPPSLFAEIPPHPEEAVLLAMGDPPIPTRRALFFKTMNEVVLPGLEAHGVATDHARAWLENPTWPRGHEAR